MSKAKVDVRCPKCNRKAIFCAELVGTYKKSPDKKGTITCKVCGKNGECEITCNDYYFQIPIGNRTLYATSLEKLIDIKDYFEKGLKLKGDPETDFPKEFYLRKEEIVKKINLILEKENGSN